MTTYSLRWVQVSSCIALAIAAIACARHPRSSSGWLRLHPSQQLSELLQLPCQCQCRVSALS